MCDGPLDGASQRDDGSGLAQHCPRVGHHARKDVFDDAEAVVDAEHAERLQAPHRAPDVVGDPDLAVAVVVAGELPLTVDVALEAGAGAGDAEGRADGDATARVVSLRPDDRDRRRPAVGVHLEHVPPERAHPRGRYLAVVAERLPAVVRPGPGVPRARTGNAVEAVADQRAQFGDDPLSDLRRRADTGRHPSPR
ncbi:hypothetical protein BRD18_06840 [Halobacteriales archaeon SW_7_71_33]|nr:MAG: hypothetical protein BRD18_06840 [Halobacteriales archaeon SW_7_71_33]